MPIAPTYTFWEDIWHLTWLLPALLCLSIFICLTLMYILAFIFSQRTDKWTTFLYRETAHCGCILRVSTLSSQFLYPQWLTKRGLGKWGEGKQHTDKPFYQQWWPQRRPWQLSATSHIGPQHSHLPKPSSFPITLLWFALSIVKELSYFLSHN